MNERRRATPRVREHVDRLREAGLDTQKFFDALVSIRDDSALPRAHRQALYKLLAMESFVWYLEALRNEPIDRLKLRDEINRIGAEHDAAIRRKEPGEKAAALATSDLSGNKAPHVNNMRAQRARTSPESAPQAEQASDPERRRSSNSRTGPKKIPAAATTNERRPPAPGKKPQEPRKIPLEPRRATPHRPTAGSGRGPNNKT